MWNNEHMKSHVGANSKMEILASEFGFPSITPPENTTITKNEISEENKFFAEAVFSTEDSYNPVDISLNKIGASVVQLMDTKHKIVGQIISIPHDIFLRGVGKHTSILSTHLSVAPDVRKKRYAEALILTTIKEAFAQNIKIGYHWVREKKTDSAITSFYWYRPLRLSSLIGKGYDLKKGISYQPPVQDPTIKATLTTFEDFSKIKSSTSIRLFLSEEQLSLIKNVITFYTFVVEDKVIGIAAFRKFDIIKPQSKVRIDAAQLCYFDCSLNYNSQVFTKLLYILLELNYASLHGVIMSNMGTLINSMNLSLTDAVYLDFCNITHPNLQIQDVALLLV